MTDHKLAKGLFILLLIPVGLATCSGDRFRYPCQDPENWNKQMCQLPYCDVTRTCPEQIFKGQRDPRQGPPPPENNNITKGIPPTGVNCK
jgi:hypothetical protein